MERNPTYATVVGIDLSETGDHALSEALALVRDREGAELHVVHVVTETDLAEETGGSRFERQNSVLEQMPNRLWGLVEAAGQRLHQPPGQTRVSVHVRFGEPAETLHQVAVDYDADMIVVGTHGRRGIRRMVLGSVASHLVQIARCPVVVARPKDFDDLLKTERIEPARSDAPSPQQERHEPHVYRSTRLMSWLTHNSDTTGPTGISML